jgi:hypothetical protein
MADMPDKDEEGRRFFREYTLIPLLCGLLWIAAIALCHYDGSGQKVNDFPLIKNYKP